MKNFAEYIKNDKVDKGTVKMYFMGQAGYLIKDSEGHIVAYDIYLSDCCEREFGFKRFIAKLLEPEELYIDALICSHGHYDHLDIDAIPNMKVGIIYTPKDGIEELNKLGITSGHMIQPGSVTIIGNMEFRFVFCDHGPDTPYAVGTVMSAFGRNVYFAGDTCLRDELVNEYTINCDIAILPINGAFGNLDEYDSVELAKRLNCKTVIPCHFWNFAEHGGDPAKFAANALKSKVNYRFMRQGEAITV